MSLGYFSGHETYFYYNNASSGYFLSIATTTCVSRSRLGYNFYKRNIQSFVKAMPKSSFIN